LNTTVGALFGFNLLLRRRDSFNFWRIFNRRCGGLGAGVLVALIPVILLALLAAVADLLAIRAELKSLVSDSAAGASHCGEVRNATQWEKKE
jgi:hypothetical protein